MPIYFNNVESDISINDEMTLVNKLVVHIKSIEKEANDSILDGSASRSEKIRKIDEYKRHIALLRQDRIEYEGELYSFRETIMPHASDCAFEHKDDINKAVSYLLFNGSWDALSIYFHAYRLIQNEDNQRDFLNLMSDFFEMYLGSDFNRNEQVDSFMNCYLIIKNWFEKNVDIIRRCMQMEEYITEEEINFELGILSFTADTYSYDLKLLNTYKSILEEKKRYVGETGIDIEEIEREIGQTNEKIHEIFQSWHRDEEWPKITYCFDGLFYLVKYCELKRMNNTYSNELEDIYDELEDIYDELKKVLYSKPRIVREHNEESGIEYKALELSEQKNKNGIALSLIQDLAETIRDESKDIGVVLSNLRKNISSGDWTEDEHNLIDNALMQFGEALAKRLKKHEPSFSQIFKDLKSDIEGKYFSVSEDILSFLASAEYLYKSYIIQRDEMPKFDYGSISILYYQAFERAYNELIVRPYIEYMKKKGVKIALKDSKDSKGSKFSVTPNGYIPDNMTNSFITEDDNWKNFLMYGNFSTLMKYAGNKKNCVVHFTDFLKELFKENYNLTAIKDFASDVKKASKFRNEAAHGDKIIKMKDAEKDKETIYPDVPGEEYLRLLIRLLEFCS